MQDFPLLFLPLLSSQNIVIKTIIKVNKHVIISFCVYVGGADLYSNSFISPNSAEEVGVSLNFDESQARLIDPTKTPGAVNEEASSKLESGTVAEPNNRVLRSAVPILSKTTAGDNLLLYKNVEDAFESNDVELSGRLGHIIQPSRTVLRHKYRNNFLISVVLTIIKLLVVPSVRGEWNSFQVPFGYALLLFLSRLFDAILQSTWYSTIDRSN